MISGLLASRAGFLDSGTLPETYQKPFKSMPESMISGLVASELDFLILAPSLRPTKNLLNLYRNR